MEIRSVAVIGAGTMGAGIAQICAQAGWDTRLYDAFPEVLLQDLLILRRFGIKELREVRLLLNRKKNG